MRPVKMVAARNTLKGRASLAALGLAGLAALGLASLGGCASDPDEKAPQCPQPYLLPDAASLTRYGPRGTDLTDLVLSGRMIDVKGGCGGVLGGKHVTAHAHVVMVLTRGPASSSNTVDLPYSIGIVKSGQVLQAKDYVEHVVFPPNVNTVQVTGQEVNFDFPTPKGVTGPNYHVYFYFQLTPGELARNKARATPSSASPAP